mgnify:CR=1 FL=1
MADLPSLPKCGAIGVGLFRTELQFLIRATVPKRTDLAALDSVESDDHGTRLQAAQVLGMPRGQVVDRLALDHRPRRHDEDVAHTRLVEVVEQPTGDVGLAYSGGQVSDELRTGVGRVQSLGEGIECLLVRFAQVEVVAHLLDQGRVVVDAHDRDPSVDSSVCRVLASVRRRIRCAPLVRRSRGALRIRDPGLTSASNDSASGRTDLATIVTRSFSLSAPTI